MFGSKLVAMRICPWSGLLDVQMQCRMRDGPAWVLANERHLWWIKKAPCSFVVALTNSTPACRSGEVAEKLLFPKYIRVEMEGLLFTLRRPHMAFIASLDSTAG
jgi:hypothetical protein